MVGLKHKITAIVFAVILFSIAALYVVLEHSAFSDALEKDGLSEKYDAINGVYEKELPLLGGFVDLWGGLQKLMNVRLYDDAEYGYIALDDSGKLHFPVGRSNADDEVQATVALAQRLAVIGVDFSYIQFPSKNIKGYTVLPEGAVVMTNENADDLLAGLERVGIGTLDIRDTLSDWSIGCDEMFYKSDHHWTTMAAFEAFCDTLDYLTGRGYDLDPDGYFSDIANYNVTFYEKSYIGSQGRRVGRYVTGLDDYRFISPKFDTNFTVTDLLNSSVIGQGSFDESIVREHILTDYSPKTNRHAAYFEWDYGNLRIENHAVDSDVKILLIKDSFSLPYSAFLANTVSELHMIDMREGGHINIAEYAYQWGIDIVLIAYNPGVFDGVMFSFK